MTYTPDAFAADTGVSRETLAAFEVWRTLLLDWSERMNLVGASTLPDFWRRHALDSAQVFDHLPESAREIVDLGSGAGFPGIAIALLLRDRGRLPARVRLIESTGKKAAFLSAVVAATGAPAVVLNVRAEAAPPEPADVITARAFAPLTRLASHAERFWQRQTVGVFLKGRDVEAELTEARKSWRFRHSLSVSRSDPQGQILRLEDLEHGPANR